jgi:hypothetical protein
MLYKKDETENPVSDPELFSFTDLVPVFLIILVVAIALSSPHVLARNINDIATDFGIKL